MLEAASRNPLAPKAPHQAAKAKSVIYLFMHGGVSHVDTFDPKPELAQAQRRVHLGGGGEGAEDESHRLRESSYARQSLEVPPWVNRAWRFPNCFPHIGSKADEIALIRSCYGEAFDHAPAIYLRNTGSQFPGRPCLGSWVVYGLGSENQNLPAFVVMSDGATKSGPQAYCVGVSAGGVPRHGIPRRAGSGAEPRHSGRRERKSAAVDAGLHQ